MKTKVDYSNWVSRETARDLKHRAKVDGKASAIRCLMQWHGMTSEQANGVLKAVCKK